MNDFFLSRQDIRFVGALTLLLIMLLLGTYVLEARVKRRDESIPSKLVTRPIENIELEAKSAFVYDTRTKTVLYEKNADVRLPLASLTKVMAALVATDLTPDYSTVVYNGEKWLLKDLLDFTLTRSSNDGIRAVALALGALRQSNLSEEEIQLDFVREMNEKANELGMKNTYYFNVTGLDEDEVKNGAYGTAKDMTVLFDHVLRDRPTLLESTKDSVGVFVSLDDKIHTVRNTNTEVSKIPGIKGSKTGFTDVAGGNLVVAFDPELGRTIIVSVLGSSEHGRFEDVLELVSAVMESIGANEIVE